jgi:hypothetical protein
MICKVEVSWGKEKVLLIGSVLSVTCKKISTANIYCYNHA